MPRPGKEALAKGWRLRRRAHREQSQAKQVAPGCTEQAFANA
jgi:hypothetical protein